MKESSLAPNEIESLPAQAHDDLRAVEVLQANDLLNAAASRLYYAGFNAAEALLAQSDQRFKTHQSVIREVARRATLGEFEEQLDTLKPNVKQLVDAIADRVVEIERERAHEVGRRPDPGRGR